MAALRRHAAVAAFGALAAVAAAAAVAAFAGGGSPASATPTAPLAVAGSFEPASVQFGDELTATVTVLLDRSSVRAETLRLADDLAPLTQLGPSRTSRTVDGRLETVTVRVPVACLTDPCVARAGANGIALPRLRASVASRGGSLDAVAVQWPRLRVGSRVAAADLASATPRFALDAAPGRPGFRLPPAMLLPALGALAAACAAGALALLLLELDRLRRARRPAPGELERAVRLVRESARRPAADRRRALGLLGRLLRARDAALGSAADDLAWSESGPDGERLRELLERVEGSGRP